MKPKIREKSHPRPKNKFVVDADNGHAFNAAVWPYVTSVGRLACRRSGALRIFDVNRKLLIMKNNFTRPARILFAIPWIIFGIQHFMYADFVATLVPAYMPVRIFWVYLTAIAMIAAGISFIIDRKVKLAATLLGIMLSIFILLIHTATLAADWHSGIHWTRALQDITITGAAFALASISGGETPGVRSSFVVVGKIDLVTAARYLYAFPLIFLGAQHFMGLAFVTGKIPEYLPAKTLWDYLMGSLIIVAAISLLLNKKAMLSAMILGFVLLLFALLLHGPLLVTNIKNGLDWTGAMLDLAIAAGAFLVADSLPRTAEGRSGELAEYNIG